jgi:hypothetical protein
LLIVYHLALPLAVAKEHQLGVVVVSLVANAVVVLAAGGHRVSPAGIPTVAWHQLRPPAAGGAGSVLGLIVTAPGPSFGPAGVAAVLVPGMVSALLQGVPPAGAVLTRRYATACCHR